MKEIETALLRELMAAFAHDLRNPLSAVVTNLEFARRLLDPGTSEPDLVEALDDCAVACELLRRIAANLDLVSRSSDAIEPEHLAVSELWTELTRSYGAVATQAAIQLELAPAPASLHLMSDRAILLLALENLLANALQHAPRNSCVRMSARQAGDELFFEVRDEGAGIPNELRAAALSASGHTANGRKVGTRYGRGLGLLSAAEAARRIDGSIEIAGDPNGSCFTLVVPQHLDQRHG